MVLRVHVGSSLEKKPTQLCASSAHSKVKRCVTFVYFTTSWSGVVFILIKPFATLGIHVSSTVEEKSTQLFASLPNSHMKRRLTPVPIIHDTSSTSVEKEGAQLDVLLPDSLVKRRAAVNTGIKIQPTDTQVSVSRSGNEPLRIDTTTLLAQRGNSTHSQRRHSIDAVAF
eukprot:Rhum_TRINITY_DN15214_c1_g1::Rhum_TRINITY_DN15214_c1_g1_i6::g.144583::m.144583